MILFVDVETNKLLRKGIPLDDPTQPHIIDLAAILCHRTGESFNHIRREVRLPGNASVQQGAEAVHGVSTRAAKKTGCDPRWAIYGLWEMANESEEIATFGDFDIQVVKSAMLRLATTPAEIGRWLAGWDRPTGKTVWDVKEASTVPCRLPSDGDMGGYRWPNLDVACEKILGMPPRTGPHKAWDDAQRVRLLYFKLAGMAVIEVPV